MSDTRACRKCGMKIEFRVGPNGKILPLQRVRSVYVLDQGGQVDNANAAHAGAEAIYVSHFETCPNASDFSRGRKEA